uniref:Killer cell lectin like receptor B1 n=1 Tax=Catagonus wagneri TaxID=51154 RepID=A0A8C3WB48_9CETA
MERQVIYADLNLSRDSGLESSTSPSLPQNVCQGPSWHRFALKLGCAGITLLALAVVWLSVSVIFLRQKLSIEKTSLDVQESRNETTERPALLTCPTNWHPIRDKCLFFNNAYKHWNDSLADCSAKETSLLLIQDKEELRLIQNLIDSGGIIFWIGLNFTLPEKNWKWINGSFLSSKILQVTGFAGENNCVSVSKTQMLSESCDSDNKWICQKELKPVRNKVCSVS